MGVEPSKDCRRAEDGPDTGRTGVAEAGSVWPGGRQSRLVCGDQEVVVTEVGATLRSYLVAGVPVLDGFPESEICRGARGQLLLPWPNRLGDGRYRFGGEEYQLPLDEPELHNAINGLARWASWVAEPDSATRLTMRHRLHAQPGYPFCLDLTAVFELDQTGLTVIVSAANIGTVPAPFGAGAHPYLRVGTPVIDTCQLQVPASTVLTTDSRMLPTGRVVVEGTELDFRTLRTIGDHRLDITCTDLVRDRDGLARVILEAPTGRRLTLWADEAHRWLQLFTGDTLPRPERRRSIAVEPMTCPPDAFRSAEDLVVLEPGETVIVRWGIDVTGFRG
jgi:aldose 1-epimerase